MKRLILFVLCSVAVCWSLQAQTVEGVGLQSGSSMQAGERLDASVERRGNTYFCGGLEMGKRDYRDFLYSRSPLAYDEFTRGYKLSCAGWAVMGTGLAAESLGVLFFCGATALLSTHRDVGWMGTFILVFGSVGAIKIGAGLCVLGGTLILASVPMLGVGYSRMHKSVEVYNVDLQTKATLSFGVSSSENGVGLALCF